MFFICLSKSSVFCSKYTVLVCVQDTGFVQGFQDHIYNPMDPLTCSWEELHLWSSLLSNTKLACIPPLELHPSERGRWNQTDEGTLKPPLLSIMLENIRSLPNKMELFACQMAGGESVQRSPHNHCDRNLARRSHFKQ